MTSPKWSAAAEQIDGEVELTDEFATAARIRSGLARYQGEKLQLEDKYQDLPPALGGEWRSASDDFSFTLAAGTPLTFRVMPQDQALDVSLVEGRLSLGQVCRVNVCATVRSEEIAPPQAGAPLFPGLRRPIAFKSHVSVEQINYSDMRRPSVDGLTDEDLGRIAEILASPMQDLLRRSVEYLERSGRTLGLPVLGELHWNWRRPRHHIAEFHRIGAGFVQGFPARRSPPASSDDYVASDKDILGKWFDAVDEPGLRVFLPFHDRDSPSFFMPEVTIDGYRVQFDVHDMGLMNLREYGITLPTALPLLALSVHLMVHPFSPLVRPTAPLPPGLPRGIADRAVEHLRRAWLALGPRRLNFYNDFLAI